MVSSLMLPDHRNPMPRMTPGRICLTITGLTTSIGCFVANWNKIRVKNPKYPSHARFHNGQTMLTGLTLNLLTLYYIWRPSPPPMADSLRTVAIFGSLYAVTAVSGILYPGALAIDSEFGEGSPQFPLFAGIACSPWIGYFLELRRLRI